MKSSENHVVLRQLKTDGWWALAIFCVLSLIYWLGRSLSFGAGDSPQHVVSCMTWGIPFRPGYPLYTLLGHLFSKLPLGTPEGNINGFSGLCHAGAAAFLFLLMRRFGLGIPSALTPVCLMAFSPLFWYYSEVAEVRGLNDLLAVLTAYLAVRHGQTKKGRDLAALTVTIGLGISHHPTYVFILPAIVYWLWREDCLPKGYRALACLVGVFASCAFPYLILGIRIHVSSPLYNPQMITTWRDVLHLFLRTEIGGPWRIIYGPGLFNTGLFRWEPFAIHGRWFIHALLTQPGLPGVVIVAAGAAWLAVRRLPLLWFWGLWFALGMGGYFFLASQQLPLDYPDYTRAIAMRFYLLPFIGVFACAGFGTQWLADRSRPILAWVLTGAATLALVVNPVSLKGRDALLHYAEDILASSGPRDFVLLASDDASFALTYLTLIRGRGDGRIIFHPAFYGSPRLGQVFKRNSPDLNVPPPGPAWNGTDWHAWIRRNPTRRFFAEALFPGTVLLDFPGASPHGVLVAALDKRPAPKDLAAEARRFLDSTSLGRLSPTDIHLWTQETYLAYSANLLLRWHDSLLDAKKDAVTRAEIQRRLIAF